MGMAFASQDELKISMQLIPAVDPAATFTSVVVKQTAPTTQTIPVTVSNPEWKAKVPATANGGRVVFTVEWTLKGNPDTSYKGITTVTLTRENDLPVITIDTEGAGTVTRMVAPPPPPPPRIPCLNEACDPEGRPRFPIQIPWLHEDPGHPGQAADPKVLVLAILYAVFVSQIEQLGPATTPAVADAHAKLANALNLAAWRLFYDNPPADQRLSLVDALKRLFECWCKSLLYKGPRCEPGCGTHGVVIGCAMVEGGSLRMVDPWGGRRWVMHYPLLAHWGQQFGITPPDALASKFFDLICCIAHAYPGTSGTSPVPGTAPTGTIFAAAPAGNASVFPLGASTLVFAQPANVPAHLASAGVTPARTVALNPIEFVARVAEALVPRAGAAPAAGGGFVHYTVSGIPELNFVTPAGAATGAATSAAPAPAQPQPSPSAPAAPAASGHLAEFVRSSFVTGAAVPALLRSFAETLTHNLLAALPIDVSNDAQRAVREKIASANIRSLAALLDRDPDRIHTDVLAGASTAALAAILALNEDQASSAIKLVGDTLNQMGSESRVVSRDDLRKPTALKAFKKAITTGLDGLLSAQEVSAEVDRALANGG
jgi:hypothetical protein